METNPQGTIPRLCGVLASFSSFSATAGSCVQPKGSYKPIVGHDLQAEELGMFLWTFIRCLETKL